MSSGGQVRTDYVPITITSPSLSGSPTADSSLQQQQSGRSNSSAEPAPVNVIRWSSVEPPSNSGFVRGSNESGQLVQPVQLYQSSNGQITEQRHRMVLDGDAYNLVIIDCSPSRAESTDFGSSSPNLSQQTRPLSSPSLCQTELNVNVRQLYHDHGQYQQASSSNFNPNQLAIEQRHSNSSSRSNSRQQQQQHRQDGEYLTTYQASTTSPNDHQKQQQQQNKQKQHLEDENYLYVDRRTSPSQRETTQTGSSNMQQRQTRQVINEVEEEEVDITTEQTSRTINTNLEENQNQHQAPEPTRPPKPGYKYVKRWNWNQQQFVYVEVPEQVQIPRPLAGPPPEPLFGSGRREEPIWAPQESTYRVSEVASTSIGRLPTSQTARSDTISSDSQQQQQTSETITTTTTTSTTSKQVYDPSWLVYRQPDMESVQSDPLYRDLLYELHRLEHGVTSPSTAPIVISPQVTERSTERPVFAQHIRPDQLEVGEYANVEFICRLMPISDPNMTVEWTRNGVVLQESSRIVHEHEFGVVRLQIKRCEAEDAGLYQCRARNQLGEAVSSATLRVQSKGKIQYESSLPAAGLDKLWRLEHPAPVKESAEEARQAAPKFLTHIADYVEKNEGDSVHFECCLAPVDDPELKTEWFFNGRPLITGSRFHTIDDFGFIVLDIDWLFPRDTGEYVCRATNKYGTDITRTVLRVWPDKSIVLDCQLENPVQVIDKLRQLEYPDVAPEPVSAEPSQRPAQFVEPLRTGGDRRRNFVEGDRVHLEARAAPAQDGTLTVEWFHDGKPLISGSRFKPTFDFGHIMLDILHLYPEDSGIYRCVARNEHGEAASELAINVQAKPALVYHSQLPQEMQGGLQKVVDMEASWNRPVDEEPELEPAPREPPQFVLRPKPVHAFEGSVACFCCRVSGNPRPRVTWFVNGQIQATGTRCKLKYDGMHHLTILRCGLEDAGRVEVRARNLLGECQAETQLSVKRKLDDYRGVLKNSPRAWYDEQSLRQFQLRRGSHELEDELEEEHYRESLARLRELAFNGSKSSGGNGNGNRVGNGESDNGDQSNKLVAYMEPDTPDVNLLARDPMQLFNAEQPLHPDVINKQRLVLAPAPSTVKRALKDSLQVAAEQPSRPESAQSGRQSGSDLSLRARQSSPESSSRASQRFLPPPAPSPESRVHGKEVHRHKHKQTQLERRGNRQIVREIIERETFEQEHSGLTKESLVHSRDQSPAFGRSPTPTTDISSWLSSEPATTSSQQQQFVAGNSKQLGRKVQFQPQQQQDQYQTSFGRPSSASSWSQRSTLSQDLDLENMIPPEFKQKIQPCQVIDGDSASFECTFIGEPAPKISWFRESKQIRESNLYTIQTDLDKMCSSLLIRRVSPANNAVYTVKAENAAGSAKSSANLVVDPHPLPVDVTTGTTSTSFGLSQAISSRVSTTTQASLSESNDKLLDQALSEQEDNTSLSEAGSMASNRPIKSVRKRKISGQQVASQLARPFSADGLQAPSFLHTIHEISARSGELVRLDARLAGSQPMELRWLKDGHRVRPDQRHKMVLEGDLYTLLIVECSLSDSGFYECLAANSVGEARCGATISIEGVSAEQQQQQSGRLSAASQASSGTASGNRSPIDGNRQQVQQFGYIKHHYSPIMSQYTSTSVPLEEPPRPPKIIKGLESQTVAEGKSVTLRCQISAFPAAQVSWYRTPDKLIKPSKYFRIFKDNDETYCMKILETFAEDQAEYKCVACSHDGRAQVESACFVSVVPSSPK